MTLTLLKPGQSTPITENLPDGNYFIGRGASAKIVLAYADVSERHAILSIHNGSATVEDLKSANGTYVNGMQIDRRTVLSDDSIVQIGGTVLRVTKETESTANGRDACQERPQSNAPNGGLGETALPSDASSNSRAKTRASRCPNGTRRSCPTFISPDNSTGTS